LLVNDPQHIQPLVLAVLASRSLGWLDEALNFINRSLALAPNQPAIHSLMGDILLLQKQPEQALSALLQARELGDESSQISLI
jgi:Flp pilus assembly protein TadD